MQVNLRFSLVLFLAASFITVSTNAQDEGQSNPEVQDLNQQHPELNLNDDKTLLVDVDAKASKTQPVNLEGGANATANNNKNKSDNAKPSANEKTEDDPLSFNFLYFIIQKFKISDIVDAED
jgi:hypothetical protein